MIGFLLMLFSLWFSRNIDKYRFILDKFFIIKNFGSFTEKANIGLRLVGHTDLWSKNDIIPQKKNHCQCPKQAVNCQDILFHNTITCWLISRYWYYLLKNLLDLRENLPHNPYREYQLNPHNFLVHKVNMCMYNEDYFLFLVENCLEIHLYKKQHVSKTKNSPKWWLTPDTTLESLQRRQPSNLLLIFGTIFLNNIYQSKRTRKLVYTYFIKHFDKTIVWKMFQILSTN